MRDQSIPYSTIKLELLGGQRYCTNCMLLPKWPTLKACILTLKCRQLIPVDRLPIEVLMKSTFSKLAP
jgi:hypothetical protein